MRALKKNAVVWYAPDQHFSSRNSTVLPLFGRPSAVSTATCRLARASGAVIVPFSYRRLPGVAGYALCFEPALEFDHRDVVAGTRSLVQILERFIRQCPEQYAWTRHLMKSRGRDLPAVADREATRRRTPQTSAELPGIPTSAK